MQRRRLTLAIAFAVLLSALGATADAWSYLGFEQVTIAATAIGLTSSKINAPSTGTGAHPPATAASCRLETAEVRYTYDGTTPTTTVGTLLEPGDTLTLTGNDVLNNFLAIRTGGTSGVIDCTYSRP